MQLSAFGLSTRLLCPVQMTTGIMLGASLSIAIRFLFPTHFNRQLVDCATRGINDSARGVSIRCSSLTSMLSLAVEPGTHIGLHD